MRHSTSRQILPAGYSPNRDGAETIATNVSVGSSKENHIPAEAANEAERRRVEELRAEVDTLRYKLENVESERELWRLGHENELREERRRAHEDFKAKQAADAEKNKALAQVEALSNALKASRTERQEEKRELGSRVLAAEKEARTLHDRLDELGLAKDEAARLAEKQALAVDAQLLAAKRREEELKETIKTLERVLGDRQKDLAHKEEAIGGFEAEILRLKALTGDAETMACIKRELSEQVSHMHSLQVSDRKQTEELKHLRETYRAVEVVEEEKHSLRKTLEHKSERVDQLEALLGEEQQKSQRLEGARRAWTGYLERESSSGNPIEFDSPEAMARALVSERINSASLVERLGQVEPELVARENIIRALEDEKAVMLGRIEKMESAPRSTDGANARRLERQRDLMAKEVDLLRAQLHTFDEEEKTINAQSFDRQGASRIQELEKLVDEYKKNVEELHSELASIETSASSYSRPALGSKRPHEPESQVESDQIGSWTRKYRNLQSEFSELQKAHQMLEKDLGVRTEQLAQAQKQLETRILALKSNPSSEQEKVKMQDIKTLRAANADLQAQLERRHVRVSTVPASQLAVAQRETAAARAETASALKKTQRLKEVWAAKSAEFKAAVDSTLGWQATFLPGGKMRVESSYCPSRTDEHENSIVFDGDRGTMKVGGGPRSAFAERIAEHVRFWLRGGESSVPCFLAALTLQFYEDVQAEKADVPAA